MGYAVGTEMLVAAHDLEAFAWSAPMRDLAAKVGMSDVGLKKLLASRGVTLPRQGYWNKVPAGERHAPRREARPRRPGEAGRIRVDARFANLLSPARPLPSTGPFASELVPEDIGRLYQQELEAIGAISVPRSLEQPHRGLLRLLKQERRRQERAGESGFHGEQPRFSTPLDRRRLRLLNGLFLALARRGHDGEVWERGGELESHAIVGDTCVEITIVPAGRCRMAHQQGVLRPAPDLPARTALRLSLCADVDDEKVRSWEDDGGGPVESKIAVIAAATIVAGESRFRRSLHDAEERAARERARQEDQRHQELARRNEERLRSLHESAGLLRQAQELRAVVASVRAAIQGRQLHVTPTELADWERWALSEADRIDPVMSGQVLSHLVAATNGSPSEALAE